MNFQLSVHIPTLLCYTCNENQGYSVSKGKQIKEYTVTFSAYCSFENRETKARLSTDTWISQFRKRSSSILEIHFHLK